MKYRAAALYSFNSFTVIFNQFNTKRSDRLHYGKRLHYIDNTYISEGKQWPATTKFNVHAPIHLAHTMESAANASTITEGWVKCLAVFSQNKEKKHMTVASTCSTKTVKAEKINH